MLMRFMNSTSLQSFYKFSKGVLFSDTANNPLCTQGNWRRENYLRLFNYSVVIVNYFCRRGEQGVISKVNSIFVFWKLTFKFRVISHCLMGKLRWDFSYDFLIDDCLRSHHLFFITFALKRLLGVSVFFYKMRRG